MFQHTKYVYLAGPITGLDFDGCTDWRKLATRELLISGITALSPMRCKEFLRDRGPLKAIPEKSHSNPLAKSKGIMSRDRFDATRSDVLLVNLLDTKIVSIGTCMEIAWADLNRIPIVCAIEETGNIHDHAMLSEAINFRVTTLEEAIEVVKAILE